MAAAQDVFGWADGTDTAAISATSASARGAINGDGFTFRVYNAGPDTVFIQKGTSTVTAATTDTPVPPGGVEVFSRNPSKHTHLAAITDTAGKTATVYVTGGGGA